MSVLRGTATEARPVDLTSGAAYFISGAVVKLSQVADLCRNLPSGRPLPSAIRELATIGVHYDPYTPAFFMQDRAAVRVSITLRDGAAEFAVTQEARS